MKENERAIYKARRWIKLHKFDIGKRFFEDVAEEYPGDYRAFMIAWCDEYGGI